MHDSIKKLKLIKIKVNDIVDKKQLKITPEIIAVTKTFSADKILPIIEGGHIHFGENKIQEAEPKWTDIKKKYKNLKLHMIGQLQTNKAKKAVKLFDYIHSLDNVKLASKINQYEKELNKKTKIFIQVNLGNDHHKSGIMLNNLENFYNYCTKELTLDVVGLMCLPPINIDSVEYFKILKSNSDKLDLVHLSMGMSSDYLNALENGSTFIRLGTAIFGERETN